MSTRISRKLASTLDNLQELTPTKRNVATNTDEQMSEYIQKESIETVQSPVFNIHIHVPEYKRNNSDKMYLPRIQPIIHLHYDELVEKLGNYKSQQNLELNSEHLQNILLKATPKFGGIKFHYKNDLHKTHFAENRLNIAFQHQNLNNKRKYIDTEVNENGVVDNISNHISEVNEQSNNNSDNINRHNGNSTRNITDRLSSPVLNNNNIKLKKAVVVLEDISKSKTYKGMVVDDLSRHEKNEASITSTCAQMKRAINSCLETKIKNMPASPRADSPVINEKADEFSNSVFLNPSSGTKCFESKKCDILDKKKSLVSLLEGCNFSEIIRRFREKKSKFIVDALAERDIVFEVHKKCERQINNKNVCSMQNSILSKKENCSEQLDNKNEEESQGIIKWLKEEPSIESKSDETSIQFSLVSHTEKIRCEAGISESNSFSSPSVSALEKVVDMTAEGNEIHDSLMETNVSSDNEITGENKLNSVFCDDFKIVELHSPNKPLSAVIKNEFDLPETNEYNLIVSEVQNSGLKLKEKKMSKDKNSVNKQEAARSQSENAPSPKKKKHSHITSEKPTKEATVKSPVGENYIPLNVSGPTRFAVAPLPELQAYKTHDAKNFRNEMLFGSRIKRFSDSDHLHIYKMKKQAAGRRCD